MTFSGLFLVMGACGLGGGWGGHDHGPTRQQSQPSGSLKVRKGHLPHPRFMPFLLAFPLASQTCIPPIHTDRAPASVSNNQCIHFFYVKCNRKRHKCKMRVYRNPMLSKNVKLETIHTLIIAYKP